MKNAAYFAIILAIVGLSLGLLSRVVQQAKDTTTTDIPDIVEAPPSLSSEEFQTRISEVEDNLCRLLVRFRVTPKDGTCTDTSEPPRD